MATGKGDSASTSTIAGGSIPFLLPSSNDHQFWETQPVTQFNDVVDPTLPDGPIISQIPLSNLNQNPCNLPAQFEWTAIDIDDEAIFSDLHQFISKNYAGNVAPLPFPSSAAFLRWLLRAPNHMKSLHVAVGVKETKKIVGFIAATPSTIRIRTEIVRVAVAIIICVHQKLRSKRLAPILIRELIRRAQLEGIWHGIYATEMHVPTPFCTTRLLYRFLNVEKMNRWGHLVEAVPRQDYSIRRLGKWFKVAKAVATRGFRKMESGDVAAVSEMLQLYLKKFQVAPEVDHHFVEHFLLPQAGLVDSYVVEDLETKVITDFCSFLIHNVAIDDDPEHSELKCVVLFYYANYKTRHHKLMKDVMVMAKKDGADLFLAYDIMGNYSFLDGLLFRPKNEGEEKMINYYFYNYRLKGGMQPWEFGLIL